MGLNDYIVCTHMSRQAPQCVYISSVCSSEAGLRPLSVCVLMQCHGEGGPGKLNPITKPTPKQWLMGSAMYLLS